MWRSEETKSTLAEQYRRYAPFVLLPLVLLALFSSCSGRSGPAAPPDTTVQDAVRAYGATAILTYLTATPADGAKLAAIYGEELIKPPAGQQSIPLPRLNVLASFASAKQPGAKGDWLVSLTAITDSDTQTFTVPIHPIGSGYRPTALPGLVPGTVTGTPVTVNESNAVDVKSASPVATTLRDFFNAWLAGKGDLSRVADTKTVEAFSSAPFGSVQVMAASAVEQIPDQPTGDLTVGVTVWGMHTQMYQLSYTLKLSASAGRWVVTDIAATPPVSEAKDNSPTPTSGP
ncbi:conjugal transfer protein [Mycolicibacterium llatzerense]|uniref:conjugal transfer protein n=1 Tax=Mycolicibacterium llatzerense TaxID=280871 RepID=UPI0021B552FD|nr:conjugal transfer protein [Mycolicibacterium llatzerense]